ncbi:hypothetical protein SAMN05442782_8316 [Streptomyces sp. OK228]|nr:hypothetical protein SAMN05442782_8316 [Streptomyces sp. OK228]
MDGGGVRCQRMGVGVRMGHAQPVHGHHGVRPTGVERQVQLSLGRERPSADSDQRTLPPAQQTADHEDRQSAEDLHPHGGRRAHGQHMPPGGEQHTQHGEHGRAQTPHRQGHVHVTRCRQAAGESLPFTAHPHHRHVLPGQTAPLYESDADPVQFPGDQNAARSRPAGCDAR